MLSRRRIHPYLWPMPYRNDPRRTVTLNFHPDEYTALAEDAFEAGYATPGTYALALVRARGDAPAPIPDPHAAERIGRLEGSNEWLVLQFEARGKQLEAAGLRPRLAPAPPGGELPRSRAAQERAVDAAVEAAVARTLAQERARVARGAAPDAGGPPRRP